MRGHAGACRMMDVQLSQDDLKRTMYPLVKVLIGCQADRRCGANVYLAYMRGWRNTFGNLIEFVWLKKPVPGLKLLVYA